MCAACVDVEIALCSSVTAAGNQHVEPTPRPVLLVPVRTLLQKAFALHGAARIPDLTNEQTTAVAHRGQLKVILHNIRVARTTNLGSMR